jgi:hypothetical protein
MTAKQTGPTRSITLETAKDKIDAPDGKVAAAYKLAKAKKSSGRLNLSDIRMALKQMQHHAPMSFSSIRKKLSGSASGGVIKRRGGGIAKRGMGAAK